MISNEIINHGLNSKYPTVKREIKFRAWDNEENKMLFIGEFDLYHEEDNGFHSGKLNKHGDWYNLPLMQLTGLVDKKESELYADDIIDITRYEETTRHQIIWKEGGWQLYPPGPFPTQYLGCFKSAIIEKKGNIFENKELKP